MKKIFFILLITIVSCKFSIDKNQVFPKIDYENISEIEINKYRTDYKLSITEKNKIERFKEFFNDSRNYDKTVELKLENYKLGYILKIKQKNNLDTFTYNVYESENNDKAIIGFVDPIQYRENHEKYRKYHRFYIDSKIINLINNIND